MTARNRTSIEFNPFDPIDEAVDVSTVHREANESKRKARHAERRNIRCPACGEVIGRAASATNRTPIEIKPHNCPHGGR